jgi:hypothetical protein
VGEQLGCCGFVAGFDIEENNGNRGCFLSWEGWLVGSHHTCPENFHPGAAYSIPSFHRASWDDFLSGVFSRVLQPSKKRIRTLFPYGRFAFPHSSPLLLRAIEKSTSLRVHVCAAHPSARMGGKKTHTDPSHSKANTQLGASGKRMGQTCTTGGACPLTSSRVQFGTRAS